jgi:hypothetical protein
MRTAAPYLLWLAGAGLFLALMAERATTPVLSQTAFITLLTECGASGQPIEEAVRAVGLSERAWGRSVARHASDLATANGIEQRLAAIHTQSQTTVR